MAACGRFFFILFFVIHLYTLVYLNTLSVMMCITGTGNLLVSQTCCFSINQLAAKGSSVGLAKGSKECCKFLKKLIGLCI